MMVGIASVARAQPSSKVLATLDCTLQSRELIVLEISDNKTARLLSDEGQRGYADITDAMYTVTFSFAVGSRNHWYLFTVNRYTGSGSMLRSWAFQTKDGAYKNGFDWPEAMRCVPSMKWKL